MQQGIFNVITTEDVTKMSAQAKKFIEERAQQSILFDQVETQKSEILRLLKYMLTDSEWKLKIEEQKNLD